MKDSAREKIYESHMEFYLESPVDDLTGMFNNHLAGDAEKASQYLPEPEMIRFLIPDPAGYGTGREDCMLNAGLMMDTVIAQYEVTGEKTMRAYALKI